MIYKTLYGNPLDFSKIYDKVMNDEIKLTYLLFSVYLSVLRSLGPFGAILSDLSSVRFPLSDWPLRLYAYIVVIVIYCWKIPLRRKIKVDLFETKLLFKLDRVCQKA